MAYKNSRFRPEWPIVFTKFRPQLNVHILIYTDLFIERVHRMQLLLTKLIREQLQLVQARINSSWIYLLFNSIELYRIP